MTVPYHDSRSTSPFSSSAILHPSTSSPKRNRIVGFCKNCSNSFRVSQMNCGEFCSKDCETCFTIFYKQISPAPSKVNNKNTTSNNRFSIYEFQQQIAAEDLDSYDSANSKQNKATGLAPMHFSDFDYNAEESEDSIESKKLPSNNDLSQPTMKSIISSPEDSYHSDTKPSMLRKLSSRLFFASPKRESPAK